MSEDMREIRQKFVELQKSVGSSAYIYCTLNVYLSKPTDFPIKCVIYPFGTISHSERFEVKADTWDELVDKAYAKWAEHSDRHTIQLIAKMALSIIKITDENGSCTAAALRSEHFSEADIERVGDKAVLKANEMSQKGPFEIAPVPGTNITDEDAEAIKPAPSRPRAVPVRFRWDYPDNSRTDR